MPSTLSQRWCAHALHGVVYIVFGLAALLFLWPAGSALAIVWVLGAYAAAFGIVLLALSLSMRRRSEVLAGAEPEATG